MIKKILICTLSAFYAFGSYASTDGYQGYDSKAPVEITSDTLEIEQNKQKAVFKGNVEAIQSNITIKSDEMLVHYKSGGGESQNSVSKVETVGNVTLKTPKETASSNKGVFDVDKKLITLLGNVSLKSGKNVVKGEKFVYNLNTGKSSIVSDTKQEANGTEKKGRVKGIFIPEQ
ncbi:MAG: lipopolysaccharide transport periplasmic protein LptA [Alphaproteobacteria bacterium CG11_big_fil_rev_8_21_14_0_20_39_49]|nr:MAG: lipopolysaccharide transport periplasmic protein LptA [Alphaproteobacteria bacterium CG11_big_fil_rev_8_21_14_0_20_39_49]